MRTDFGPRACQDVLQVVQRQARVHDVFDDEHVAALERGIEVLEQPDFAGGRRACRVARERHEVERHGHVDGAHEVGQEHERALQHADDVQLARVGVVAADVGGELAGALRDGGVGDEDGARHGLYRGRCGTATTGRPR